MAKTTYVSYDDAIFSSVKVFLDGKPPEGTIVGYWPYLGLLECLNCDDQALSGQVHLHSGKLTFSYKDSDSQKPFLGVLSDIIAAGEAHLSLIEGGCGEDSAGFPNNENRLPWEEVRLKIVKDSE